MISQPRRPKCLVCGQPATRRVLDRPGRDGARRPIPLCSRCPSPRQIDQRARQIMLGWTEVQLACRVYDCGAGQVDSHRAVRFDAVYTVVVSDDD